MSESNNRKKTKRTSKKLSGIKLRWILNSLSIVVLILFAFVTATVFIISNYYYLVVQDNLTNRTETTASFMNRYLIKSYGDFNQNAARVISEFSDKDKLELQIIDTYGRVMYSSTGFAAGHIPATGDISPVLSGKPTTMWMGYDPLTSERIMAVSSPLYFANRQLVGAVRCVSTLSRVENQISQTTLILSAVALGIFLFVLISNRFFIRSIVNPVLRINETAKEIAKGHYDVRLKKMYNDEIGELCETINYMSNEIGRSERVKNDFISSVSHELRTPLTSIAGWSETLYAGGLSKQEEQKGLLIIEKEARRLSQMVEEMLDFARLESGRLVLNFERFDLRGELSDALFFYSHMLHEDGITANYDEPDDPVMVRGDRNRIRQVFVNLIDNADKYGREGGKIDIKVYVGGDMAVAEIRDYGAGIPPEELPYVKEKFYKGSSKKRGAGIGLAVSDEIVKMHGGMIDIESRVGEGTKISVKFQLSEDQPG